MPERMVRGASCVSESAAAYLTFVVGFLIDLTLQSLGRSCLLQYLILAKGQEAFEDILSDLESNDQLFPGKPRSIQRLSKDLSVLALRAPRCQPGSTYAEVVHCGSCGIE